MRLFEAIVFYAFALTVGGVQAVARHRGMGGTSPQAQALRLRDRR